MKHIIPILFLACMISCKKENTTTANAPAGPEVNGETMTYSGSRSVMGEGSLWPFFSRSTEGKPLEIGVRMTPGALNAPRTKQAFNLPIHQQGKDLTAFEHILFRWEPGAHPALPVEASHFEVYFYTLDQQQQLGIKTGAAMEKLPSSSFIPAGYSPSATGIPGIGRHWFHPEEFNGPLPFTKTFLYGSYNGNVAFYQQLATKEYLLRDKPCTIPLALPTRYAPNNTWYPTTYKIYRDPGNGEIVISLADFVWR